MKPRLLEMKPGKSGMKLGSLDRKRSASIGGVRFFWARWRRFPNLLYRGFPTRRRFATKASELGTLRRLEIGPNCPLNGVLCKPLSSLESDVGEDASQRAQARSFAFVAEGQPIRF